MADKNNRFALLLTLALLLAGSLLALSGAGLPAGVLSFVQGNAAYRAGAFGDAEIHFRQALGTGVASYGLRHNLGNALYRQGRYPEAAQWFARALRTAPPVARAALWANLGQARYRTGRVAGSYAAYRQALLLAPDDEATRQDFLFVSQRLAALRKAKSPARPTNPSKEKKEAGRPGSEDPPGKTGPPSEAAEQPLTDKYMQDVFGRISENEGKARGLVRGARPKAKTSVSDEKDY